MKTNYCYMAVLQKDGAGYSVWVPDLVGCNSYGDTVSDALKYAAEAMGLCIEMLCEKKAPIPEPTAPENIPLDSGQFLAAVNLDWLAYQRKYCAKSVKKTLTIPRYLNDLAIEKHINFSATLQEALIQKLGE